MDVLGNLQKQTPVEDISKSDRFKKENMFKVLVDKTMAEEDQKNEDNMLAFQKATILQIKVTRKYLLCGIVSGWVWRPKTSGSKKIFSPTKHMQ